MYGLTIVVYGFSYLKGDILLVVYSSCLAERMINRTHNGCAGQFPDMYILFQSDCQIEMLLNKETTSSKIYRKI